MANIKDYHTSIQQKLNMKGPIAILRFFFILFFILIFIEREKWIKSKKRNKNSLVS